MSEAVERIVKHLSKGDWFFYIIILLLAILFLSTKSWAVDLPGEDFSGDLDTLGSIAQTTDTIAFGWIRPFAAGVFLIIGCVGLVRSHFLLLAMGFGAALLILLTPKIVKEIRKKGGDSVLSMIHVQPPEKLYARL